MLLNLHKQGFLNFNVHKKRYSFFNNAHYKLLNNGKPTSEITLKSHLEKHKIDELQHPFCFSYMRIYCFYMRGSI